MAEEPMPPTQFIAPSLDELAPLFPAYELEDFIAQGGMGAVYRARQKSLDRTVAIKILPRIFGEDEQFRRAFEAEAKAMARLNHPNLIAVYDFGDIEGMLYIIMEFVKGKALYYSARNKIIDPAVALDLVATISRGLGHAHRGGIVHRDIKPANILLDVDARPKIGDFGLARPLDRDRSEGVVLGTPGYTAPEVYTREFPVDQRSDIFSVGALLYELLCGKQPSENSSSLKSGVDPRIDSFLAKATNANPNHRYHDVEDFANDLEALIPKLSGPRFATTTTTPGATPPATRVTPLASSKQKSMALPVLVVFALIGVAVAVFILKDDNAPTPVPPPSVSDDSKPDPTPPKKKDRPDKNSMANRPKPDRNKTDKPDKPKPEMPVVVEKPVESPLESLARLRPTLAKGERLEFPPTSEKNGESTFFQVTTPMTWHAARELAENHGAQLANLTSPESLEWAKNTFKSSSALWLGASDSGTEKRWFWDEGTAVATTLWGQGEPNDSTNQEQEGEDFAALSSKGAFLEDHAFSEKLPFILEWKSNGRQPGRLEEQLSKTGVALRSKQAPVFPTGTFNVGGARFLLVNRSLSWDDASSLASEAGGHLAVFSNTQEAAFISNYLIKRIPDGSSCWMGASRIKESPDLWKNVTGEIFDFYQWLPDQPDNTNDSETCLVLRREGDRIGANDESPSGHQTDHLFIEWSVPSLQNLPKITGPGSTGGDSELALEKIREDIRSRHGRDYRKFRRKYDDVVQDFLDNAISDVNNEDKLSAPLRAQFVEALKLLKEANELPESLPKLAPGRLTRQLEDARAESKQLWDNYESDFNEAKKEYIDALNAASNFAFQQSQPENGKAFAEEAKIIVEDNKRFHKIMNGEKLTPPAEEDKKEDDAPQ